MKRALLFFALLSTSCATCGNEAAFPDPIATSGVGPFRPFSTDETGFMASFGPTGRVLDTSQAVDRGMLVGDTLVYSGASPVADPEERDETLFPRVVDWAQFEPRKIYRSQPTDTLAFRTGDVLFEASEEWEEGAVFDPWVVSLDDGSVRLYYATRAAIGVASAPSLDGPFVRQQALSFPEGDARSPAVVRDPVGDGWLMFVDTRTQLILTRSTDGLSFDSPTPIIPSLPSDAVDPEVTETRFGMPGAAVQTSPTGRTTVRLYFEVEFVESDGTQGSYISMAASEDGVTFERYTGRSYVGINARAPVPVIEVVDDIVATRLYTTSDYTQFDQELRAITGGVTPLNVSYFDPPEDAGVE